MFQILLSAMPIVLAVTLPIAGAAAEKSGTPPDPNEKICEKVEIIGTRIASKRICATRAEWAERRRVERATLDDAQRRPHVGCSVVNTHTGALKCD